jgi:hypothetical protein
LVNTQFVGNHILCVGLKLLVAVAKVSTNRPLIGTKGHAGENSTNINENSERKRTNRNSTSLLMLKKQTFMELKYFQKFPN